MQNSCLFLTAVNLHCVIILCTRNFGFSQTVLRVLSVLPKWVGGYAEQVRRNDRRPVWHTRIILFVKFHCSGCNHTHYAVKLGLTLVACVIYYITLQARLASKKQTRNNVISDITRSSKWPQRYLDFLIFEVMFVTLMF